MKNQSSLQRTGMISLMISLPLKMYILLEKIILNSYVKHTMFSIQFIYLKYAYEH